MPSWQTGAYDDDRVPVSISVPGFTNIKGLGRVTINITPTSLPSVTTAEQTFAVAGVKVGDHIIVSGPNPTPGTCVASSRVVSDGTIGVTFSNDSGGAATPAAGDYQVLVIR